MNLSDLLSLCERAVAQALRNGADEAEAFGIDQKEYDVLIERNDVKICKSQLRTGIGLRIFKSKRLGFASVNSLEPLKTDKLVEKSIALAAKAPKDQFNELPKPRPIRKVSGIYDRNCEGLDSSVIFGKAAAMLNAARTFDKRVIVDGGSFNTTVGEKAIFNSSGIEASEMESSFQYSLMAFARDGQEIGSFDGCYEGTHKLKEVEVEKAAIQLAKRVVKSLHAKKSQSFNGPILLSPMSNLMLLTDALDSSVNANNVQKGMSKLAGKIGENIASPLLTVRDDGRMPGGFGSSSFDREGIPHTPIKIVDKGKLCAYLYNSYTAKKDGCDTTGHALGGPRGVPMIGVTNFIMEPGAKNKNSLISEMKRGILVTRFSGIPDPSSGDFSGVVKGGFYIEDGEIAHPLKETLIAGNIFEAMNKISGISKETENIINYRLPFVRFEDVSITCG
jgi:PmbA protein